jgi:hypothetical protein
MEVPISVNYDVPHKHKKHPLTHGVGVLTRLINLIAYKRPLLLFGIIGLIFIIIGLLAGFSAFGDSTTTSDFPFPMSMISTLFLIMGTLMVISGLLLNTLLMIMKENRY